MAIDERSVPTAEIEDVVSIGTTRDLGVDTGDAGVTEDEIVGVRPTDKKSLPHDFMLEALAVLWSDQEEIHFGFLRRCPLKTNHHLHGVSMGIVPESAMGRLHRLYT